MEGRTLRSLCLCSYTPVLALNGAGLLILTIVFHLSLIAATMKFGDAAVRSCCRRASGC
jgi:hypothetical protein